MAGITYNSFINHYFGETNSVNNDDDSIDVAYNSAELLHHVYCNNDNCLWQAESDGIFDEWLGESHQKWLRIYHKLVESNISVIEAVRRFEEVRELEAKNKNF